MAASAPRALAAGLALSGPLDTQRTCWAPCFADLETEAHRGQRLAQQGPGWGPGPLVRLQGLGSMLTLDEMGGRRAPWGPQGHPSPPGRCAGGPPRMNGPVTWAAHFKGRAWGGGGAGRRWRPRFADHGPAAPAEPEPEPVGPEDISPHPALGHPGTAGGPRTSCLPSAAWPSPAQGPWLISPGRGRRGPGSAGPQPRTPRWACPWGGPRGLPCASGLWPHVLT